MFITQINALYSEMKVCGTILLVNQWIIFKQNSNQRKWNLYIDIIAILYFKYKDKYKLKTKILILPVESRKEIREFVIAFTSSFILSLKHVYRYTLEKIGLQTTTIKQISQ